MKRQGRHQKKLSCIALLAAVALTLAGCGVTFPFGREEETGEDEFKLETLGLAPDFSYERKAELPSVRIDRLGYLPESVKTAVFRGEELPERFRVIEKDTGECAYEGSVRIDEENAGGILTGYGTFTELKVEGNYYIESDKIGCSYYFTIGQDVYLEKSKELAGIIEEARGGQTESGEETVRESLEVCETLSYLLMTYEIYPALFEKIWEPGDGKAGKSGEKFFKMLRAETDLLLSIQDEKTGGVYKEAKAVPAAEKNERPSISAEATAVYAGTMAKYSYLYQEYDWDYANICLKAAAKAWHYLDGEGRGETGENVAAGRIYAATELYRASNEPAYHNYILQNRELMESRRENLYLLFGKITYLTTKRAVERELCAQIMDGLMKEARKISADGKEEVFFEKETDVILSEMTTLALSNYAIMNHEYVTVVENHLHYLSGKNEGAASLIEKPDGVEAARLLLLFGVVEAERGIIEAAMEKEKL